MKIRAFTLAEVLVTLGIIGVISAMTLPTLTKNHQRKVYVTQLQKVYNEFSQASDSFVTSNNAVNLMEAGLNSQAAVNRFIQSQMKTVKNCETTFTDCFASEYKNMNGAAMTNFNAANSSCYALPSGASVCLTYMGRIRLIGNGFVNILVDVNGKQGPNILGRDLFVMGMEDDGTIISTFNNVHRVCIPSAANYDECVAENNKTNLQKCQSATTMLAGSDAGYWFAELLDDGWQMEY